MEIELIRTRKFTMTVRTCRKRFWYFICTGAEPDVVKEVYFKLEGCATLGTLVPGRHDSTQRLFCVMEYNLNAYYVLMVNYRIDHHRFGRCYFCFNQKKWGKCVTFFDGWPLQGVKYRQRWAIGFAPPCTPEISTDDDMWLVFHLLVRQKLSMVIQFLLAGAPVF